MKGIASPVLTEYNKELRAYELRLAEWLGLDPHSVFRLHENKTGATGPLDPPGLRVSWTATERQAATRGFNDHWSASGGADEPTTYEGRVALDFDDLREMRAAVGERPELPGIAEARAYFGVDE